MDIWKDVEGYEGVYMVSNTAMVKSLDHFVYHSDGKHRTQKGRILKQHKSVKGYIRVSLSKKGKRFHTSVHRLVAKAFINNEFNKPQVNHINGDKSDNRIENLEWCTNSENQIHAIKNGLVNHNTCEKHHNSKLSDKDVLTARWLHKKGATNMELSLKYNVSETAMSKILRNLTYKNIK